MCTLIIESTQQLNTVAEETSQNVNGIKKM
jgi:hypothetical protein